VKELFDLLDSVKFWSELEGLLSILKHLAIAAHLSQAADLRLDNVFLTFGRLFTFFLSILDNKDGDHDELEISIAQTLVTSLESRWAVMDQDPFLIAAVLNPFFGRHRLGINHKHWSGHSLYAVVERVYFRVCKEEKSSAVKAKLGLEWEAYWYREGDDKRFTDEALGIEMLINRAKETKNSPDPIAAWKPLAETSLLAALFLRLARVVPTSAPNEQLFSQYSDIHTKKRNRIRYDRLGNIQRIRADILSDHLPLTSSSRLDRKRQVAVQSLTGDAALSTTAMMAYSNLGNGDNSITSDDLDGLDYEIDVRNWFNKLGNETRSSDTTIVEDTHPHANALRDIFNISSLLDPISKIDVYDIDLTRGEYALAAESAFLEGLGQDVQTDEEDEEEPETKRRRVVSDDEE